MKFRIDNVSLKFVRKKALFLKGCVVSVCGEVHQCMSVRVCANAHAFHSVPQDTNIFIFP